MSGLGIKYGTSIEKKELKANKLKRIVEIICSNLEDFDKAYQLYGIYKSASLFKSAYSVIYRRERDNELFKGNIEYYDTICNLYSNYEALGYFEAASVIKKIEKYLINYHIAVNIINSYMLLDFNYDFLRFLIENNITENEFKFYLKTIEVLNPKLYKQYQDKYEENMKKRYLDCIERCKNVANGIRTGYLLDGSKFDILDYWRLMPFKDRSGTDFFECKCFHDDLKYSPTWLNRIYNFAKLTISDDAQVIYDYARENNLWKSNKATELDLKRLFAKIIIQKKIVIGKKEYDIVTELSLKDFNDIIDYMKNNDIPLMIESFLLVFNKYVNREINCFVNHTIRR